MPPHDDTETLGYRLRALRQNANISAAELGKAIGVDPSHINAIENGRSSNPTLNIVRAIAGYFDLTVGEFLAEEPSGDLDAKGAEMARWVIDEASEEDKQLIFSMIRRMRNPKKKAD
ncbi:MAG: helix-turn-helix domain-containing protein [Gammaproteobacteria bacterium]|nr:helix-turn-helix domain-containing protein [Gammaproteobacteria bacterium]